MMLRKTTRISFFAEEVNNGAVVSPLTGHEQQRISLGRVDAEPQIAVLSISQNRRAALTV
jgi:hypothetical protein